jgi:hypothetical protein
MPFVLAEQGLEDAFVVGGGYKYRQLGEGNCFLRLPPACRLRPVVTGWFAVRPELARRVIDYLAATYRAELAASEAPPPAPTPAGNQTPRKPSFMNTEHRIEMGEIRLGLERRATARAAASASRRRSPLFGGFVCGCHPRKSPLRVPFRRARHPGESPDGHSCVTSTGPFRGRFRRQPARKRMRSMSVSHPSSGPTSGKLVFDPEVFRRGYNRESFQFAHKLSSEPLLQVESLLRLAQRLPQHKVGWHRADISMGTSFYEAQHLHPTELPLEQALKDIEVSGSYVLLRNPEVDPEYGEFLGPLWDEIAALSEPIDPGMCYKGCFIFIASPRAVTPFHIDRVMNFHCQIIGSKTIYLWDPQDRVALPRNVLEHCVADPYSGYHPPFEEAFKERAAACPQEPGIGVHHPWAAPHAVSNGDQVSVSLAVTYRSAASVKKAALLRANYSLRKRGMTPTPPGESRLKDFGKLVAYKSLMRLRGTPVTSET